MSEGVLGSALGEISRPLKDFAEKLGGEGGEEWFLAFKRFLREENPWEIEKLSIEIPALPRLTLEELKDKYPWIHSIEYDASPTEAVTMCLGTLLRPGEERISGEEYERRRKPYFSSCLGFQHALWLVEHQDELPEFTALLGKVYIDFLGIVVVHADGYRNFPCLDQNGGRWFLCWRWTGHDLRSLGRVACSSK